MGVVVTTQAGLEDPERVQAVFQAVLDELGRARAAWPEWHSAHEGLALVMEELDELKAEVWKHKSLRTDYNLRREAVQVAAMAVRFVLDVAGG